MAAGLAGHFVAMARNNAWANHRLLSACEALTAEEFAAPRAGFFPSLRATLNHILWVDIYYIDALERDPTALIIRRAPFANILDMAEAAETNLLFIKPAHTAARRRHCRADVAVERFGRTNRSSVSHGITDLRSRIQHRPAA